MPRRKSGTPRMRPIESNSLESFGYDERTSTLYVRFRDGDTYVYYMVPRRVADGLPSAASPGGYLNTTIKAKYPFAKLDTAA